MTPLIILALGLIIGACFFLIGRFQLQAQTLASEQIPRSLPRQHGWHAACSAILPIVIAISLWTVAAPVILEMIVVNRFDTVADLSSTLSRQRFLSEMYGILEGQLLRSPAPAVLNAAKTYSALKSSSFVAVAGLGLLLAFVSGIWSIRRSTPAFNAQVALDKLITLSLLISSVLAVVTTLAIVLSLLFETLQFFSLVNPTSVLGTVWSPISSLSSAGENSVGSYGVAPLIVGTGLVSLVAVAVAAPLGVIIAIYLSQYAARPVRRVAKPLLEILAGIPTVVYGFFAILVVSPVLRRFGEGVGVDISSESALAAGLVMGVMITPYISSLCDDAISAVPKEIRDGSLALGATKLETIFSALIPAALPGMSSALLLAVSRTIGETMIVLMAAGLAASLSFNPLDTVTTVTVQIVQALTGEQQFDSAKTLSAFMLGMILFITTLIMNVFALALRRRYQRRLAS